MAKETDRIHKLDSTHEVEIEEVQRELPGWARKATEPLGDEDLTGAPHLVVVFGSSMGARFKLAQEETSIVGRLPECDLPLQEPAVSRLHCELRKLDDGQFELRDLGSCNGTYVNNVQVSRCELKHGDMIRVGLSTLKFIREGSMESAFFEAATHGINLDDLTGAFNKEYLDEVLQQNIYCYHRYTIPMCVAVFDVDDFKKVNDTFGHLAGDDVLRGICKLFQGAIRRTDMLARMGGDEFALVLPMTEISEAELCVTKLLRLLRAQSFGDRGLRITVSLGLVECNDKTKTVKNLLAEADLKLHEARRQGDHRRSR